MPAPLFCIASIDTDIVKESGRITIHRYFRTRNSPRAEVFTLLENYKSMSPAEAILVLHESNRKGLVASLDRLITLDPDQFGMIIPHKNYQKIYDEIVQTARTVTST